MHAVSVFLFPMRSQSLSSDVLGCPICARHRSWTGKGQHTQTWLVRWVTNSPSSPFFSDKFRHAIFLCMLQRAVQMSVRMQVKIMLLPKRCRAVVCDTALDYRIDPVSSQPWTMLHKLQTQDVESSSRSDSQQSYIVDWKGKDSSNILWTCHLK